MNSYTVRDLQARLAALGHSPGPIDGVMGPRTEEAQDAALEATGKAHPSCLFHSSGLHRIVMHWTGGAYGDIALERDLYHALIDRHGRVILGSKPPEANRGTNDGIYAAHTWRLNTGSIGVAVDAMAGAQESPFDAGGAPITRAQLDGLAVAVADFCETYDIPVSGYSVLTHAEVQPTLGVRQRWKWDITWLPGMARPGDPVEVGDRIRAMVANHMPESRDAA